MKAFMTSVEIKSCIVCDCERENGILLCNGFICRECEQDIVHTDTNDEKYKFYLRQLRKIQVPEI